MTAAVATTPPAACSAEGRPNGLICARCGNGGRLASMEWSYQLLDPRERVLLRRLGVFAGGWTVEAARQVAGFAPLDLAEVLDLLGRLVDKSLVQLDDAGRYRLLEAIRAYARTRAAEDGETSTVAGRRASGDRWAEADSLQFLGFSHLMQHRPAPAGELLAQSGAMADETGNAFPRAWQHIAFGSANADAGELADATTELRTGIGIARRVGDPAVEIWGCSCWALVALSRGNVAELRAIADGMDRPGRPLGEAGATVIDALRMIAADIDHAAAALSSLGQLLLISNDPGAHARVSEGEAFLSALQAGS